MFEPKELYDSVKKPKHYTEGRKFEPKDVIHDWKLSWNLGNAVKYISRAGRKGDKKEDLLKAIEYIKYEIEEIEKNSKKKDYSESFDVITDYIVNTQPGMFTYIKKVYTHK